MSDEVICAFGRLGYYFGAQRYGYQPDIITFAKGVTSGYAPLGGMLVSDTLMEPFETGTATFLHGVTFAGHPVSTAVALANLDVFEKEDLPGNVRANGAAFRLLRGFLSPALFDAGLVCRADDRGDPVIQLAPPLICGQQHFDEMEQILRSALTEA